MTEVDASYHEDFDEESFSSDEGIVYEDEAKLVDDSGARSRKDNGRDKDTERGEKEKRGRHEAKLERQDTFVLNSPNMPRKSSPRTKSAYGIAGILERASQSAGLTDDAKRYIGTHMRLLTDENHRLASENERLRGREKESADSAESVEKYLELKETLERDLKSVRGQLVKERGKNKMLIQRLKESNDSDVIWGAGSRLEIREDEGVSTPAHDMTRSSSPLSLLVLSQDDPPRAIPRSFSTGRIATPQFSRRPGGEGQPLPPPRTRASTATSRSRAASTTTRVGSSTARLKSASTASLKSSEGVDELSVLQKKLRVYRGQINSLRLEVDRLKEVICEEVGADHLDRILEGRGSNKSRGWVGRAQQIQDLQSTVKQLQRLLDDRQHSARSEQYFADSEAEDKDRRTRDNSEHSTRKPKQRRGSVGASTRRGTSALKGSRLQPSSSTSRLQPSSSRHHDTPTSSSSSSSSFSLVETSPPGDVDHYRRKCKDLETVKKASDVEKKRLGELVRLLTSRLAIFEQKTREAEKAQREERIKAAHLEKLLERNEITLRDEGKESSSTSRFVFLDHEDDLRKLDEDQLRWEVTRLREEGRALNRELGEARASREEMQRIYARMVDEAKEVYSQR